MRVVRAGTREFELELGGGQLAATIALTLRHDGGEPQITLGLDLGAVPPGRALKTIRLVDLLQGGADALRVSSLEFDLPLFEAFGVSGLAIGPMEATRDLLIDLDAIGKRFTMDLRFPNGMVDPDQALHTRLLAAGIREGRVAVRAPNDVFSVETTSAVAADLARNLKPGQPAVTFGPNEVTFDLFGKSVGPIRVLVHVVDPELAANPPTNANGSDEAQSATCVVGLRCSTVVYEFPDWLPTDSGASPSPTVGGE